MHSIRIDWAKILSESEMWDAICREGQEPTWHGRNLDALNDSWVNGGVSESGPPYKFHFLNCNRVAETLTERAGLVMEIARLSVEQNGGTCVAEP